MFHKKQFVKMIILSNHYLYETCIYFQEKLKKMLLALYIFVQNKLYMARWPRGLNENFENSLS